MIIVNFYLFFSPGWLIPSRRREWNLFAISDSTSENNGESFHSFQLTSKLLYYSMLSYVMINGDGLLQALIFITIILLAMMGNLLVIVSVLRTNNLRRQKAYYFVVSLAVAGIIGLIEKLESANLIFQTCWYLSVPWYLMPSPWFLMASGYSQCGCVICTMPWMLSSPQPPSSTFSASLCTGWCKSQSRLEKKLTQLIHLGWRQMKPI